MSMSSDLASVQPACNGSSGPATSGATGLANGGAASRPKYNGVLRRLEALVSKVQEAMAARPQLTYPLTKEVLDRLKVVMASEFRLRRDKEVGEPNEAGARARYRHQPNKRRAFCRPKVKALQQQVRRKEKRITELQTQP